MTLYVVYMPDTGNVLGAVNALGAVPPADEKDVSALVGKALPLRVSLDGGALATLTVPARRLAFHTPDDDPGVLTAPLTFGVDQVPDQKPKPALLPLPPLPAPTLTAGGLTVTVANNNQDRPVVAFVSDGPDTIPLAGVITAGTNEVTLTVSVDSGAHAVLVLVTGWAGRLASVTTR